MLCCRICLLMAVCVWLSGCTLPYLEGRSRSLALTTEQALSTDLGLSTSVLRQGQGDLSGFYALQDPLDAFAARALLIESAQKTLDVQYYIWRADRSGRLLLGALLDAAERGVRVRLLLDDNGTRGLDAWLSALDSHPNFEVRLFNPFVWRYPKGLGFITDFARANRRMHNKSMIADNSVAIVGGRNIGDEYFAASDDEDETLFADLDVLAIGPIVEETSHQFDSYWASASSYPVSSLLGKADADEREQLHEWVDNLTTDISAAAYMSRIANLRFFNQLANGDLPLQWASAQLVADDPRKGLRPVSGQNLAFGQIGSLLSNAKQQVDLVSPYFVPTEQGLRLLESLPERGVRVRVLTNALESTDVTAVHSGYAAYRKPLLASGVELFELSLDPGEKRQKSKAGFLGRSASSLHAKTFAVDGRMFFVGSFNFDPRSALLNTEMGFIIDSPALAQGLAQTFDRSLSEEAYVVALDEQGQLYWLDHSQEPAERFSNEPRAGLLRRLSAHLLAFLPIEELL